MIKTYIEAINEATKIAMRENPNSVIFGQGVDDCKRISGTTNDLFEEFGQDRVFDVPLSEEAMTGIGVGMAMSGTSVINTHMRMDFMLLAFNQIVNMMAKAKYMYGGNAQVPMVIRAIIGKSWGQGPQHSQSLYPMLMNVPGLKVVAPATPFDARSLLLNSIRSKSPTIFIEHRMLYFQKGEVAEEVIKTSIARNRVLKWHDNPDITLVGVSQMSIECLRASKILENFGIKADVIDLMHLNPMDITDIQNSVDKSKKLIFVDCSWTNGSAGAEVISRLHSYGNDFTSFRMGFADTPCPTSPTLEKAFYPNVATIATRAYSMATQHNIYDPDETAQFVKINELVKDVKFEEIEFKGPF